MRISTSSRLSCLAILALGSLACAKAAPSGGAGTFRGVATGVREIGVLEITIEEADKGPLPASGTLSFPSKSYSLTGTLDKSKAELSLSSSDGYKLVGESRPDYTTGGYTNVAGDEVGAFALLPQIADSTVTLFCGTMINTSETDTKGVVLPLAICGIPGGGAICVGPNYAWRGSLASDNEVRCSATGGALIEGNVNASNGNKWGTVENYGNWTVTPCASNGAGGGDAGVPDSAPSSGAADAEN
jgi:hypothetical protein